MTRKIPTTAGKRTALPAGYAGIHGGIVELLDAARQAAARSVNALMAASYWEIGRRIVEAEQKGKRRAGYGEQLMERLSADLTARFGRGFGVNNLESMRRFFLAYPQPEISQTLSGKLGNEPSAEKSQTVSGKLSLPELAQVFSLPWSAYVRLLSVKDDHARRFYEAEALRGGWSVRQLDRQIGSQFYERTALSKDKAAMLVKGSVAKPEDVVTPNDAIKDPYVLEFLDLKLGSLTHADVGQMHMYCNYAKEHWAYPDENPPVGLILCADKGHALARYALDGLPNKVMAANYRTVLPDAELLQKELENTRRLLESRRALSLKDDKPLFEAVGKARAEANLPPAELKEATQAAATSVWAAVVADREAIGGRYLEDCSVAFIDDTPNPFADGVRSYALDSEKARNLWEKTEQLLSAIS